MFENRNSFVIGSFPLVWALIIVLLRSIEIRLKFVHAWDRRFHWYPLNEGMVLI